VSSRRASPERFYHDEALGLFRPLATNYLTENEASPEVLSQREVTFYGFSDPFGDVDCTSPNGSENHFMWQNDRLSVRANVFSVGDFDQMRPRHIMHQMAFLLVPPVKHLEVSFATAIMAEKRQELGSYTALVK
jgi:hypothetical protein